MSTWVPLALPVSRSLFCIMLLLPFYGIIWDNPQWLAPQLITGAFFGAKVYCPHTLADGNWHIRIREQRLEFSSVVVPALSVYHLLRFVNSFVYIYCKCERFRCIFCRVVALESRCEQGIILCSLRSKSVDWASMLSHEWVSVVDDILPVIWYCWLSNRKSIWPVNILFQLSQIFMLGYPT